MRARILDETLRQYNAMQLGVFQVLAAKRDQVQTGRAYVEALRDYWRTRAALDTVLAGRLQRPLPLTGGDGRRSRADGSAERTAQQEDTDDLETGLRGREA